jgi:hypothetical protein
MRREMKVDVGPPLSQEVIVESYITLTDLGQSTLSMTYKIMNRISSSM